MVSSDSPRLLAIQRAMNSTSQRWIAVFALLTLTQCSLFKSHDPVEKSEPTAPQKLIGKVASVSLKGNFVLIQSYGDGRIPEGAVLTTRGPDDRTANLLATGETMGQFAAADIRAGQVGKNDPVFYAPPVTLDQNISEGSAEKQVVEPVSESPSE